MLHACVCLNARAIFVCMLLCDHEVVWASALSVSFGHKYRENAP